MTRIEKFESLRKTIAKDIQENSAIWEEEKKLDFHRQQLLKINHNYFAPVMQEINEELKLLNLEKVSLQNNYEYLNPKGKYLLTKLLAEVSTCLVEHDNSKSSFDPEKELVSYPLEYTTLIQGVHEKVTEFESNLEGKINNINIFVKKLEESYPKLHKNDSRDKSLKQILQDSNKLQESYQQLKVKNQVNYRLSFLLFGGILGSVFITTALLFVIFITE